jgi:hypothetical protein
MSIQLLGIELASLVAFSNSGGNMSQFSKLAPKLSSPKEIASFLNDAKIDVIIGKLGGRTYVAKWGEDTYKFKLNDLVKHALSKAKVGTKKQLTGFIADLNEWDKSGKNKLKEHKAQTSIIHKIQYYLTRLKQTLGKTIKVRADMFKKIQQIADKKPPTQGKEIPKDQLPTEIPKDQLPDRPMPEGGLPDHPEEAQTTTSIATTTKQKKPEPTLLKASLNKINGFGKFFRGAGRISDHLPPEVKKDSPKLQKLAQGLNAAQVQLMAEGVSHVKVTPDVVGPFMEALIQDDKEAIKSNLDVIAKAQTKAPPPTKSVEELLKEIDELSIRFRASDGKFKFSDLIPDKYKGNKQNLEALLLNLNGRLAFSATKKPLILSKDPKENTIDAYRKKVEIYCERIIKNWTKLSFT